MALTIGNPMSSSLSKEESMQAEVYTFSLYGMKKITSQKMCRNINERRN